MNYEDLKNKLTERQKELEERLEKTGEHIRHSSGPVDPDFEEQVIERGNDDVVYNLNDLAKTELIQIKSALQRMEKGEYGICSRCGEEISIERLQSIPYTTVCKNCAQ